MIYDLFRSRQQSIIYLLSDNLKAGVIMTVIYIDTLFFLNLVINYLLLLSTAKLAGAEISRGRIFLGGMFGALYAVAAFLPGAGFLTTITGKILSSLIMALIAFCGKNKLLRLTLLFWAVSFAFGGCVFAVNLLSGGPAGFESGIVYAPVSSRTLLLSVGISYVLIALVFKGSARHGGIKKEITKTIAFLEGRKIEMQTLLDSGNTLTDPLTSRPVIIAEHSTVNPLLPFRLRHIVDGRAASRPVETMENLALLGEARLFRLIPYKAVGIDSGMLLALKPDNIIVGGESRKGALLAISPNRLSDGGNFTALSGI